MGTYKKNCMYCDGLIPGDSKFCSICNADDPFSLRCPRCSNVVEKGWKVCSSCRLSLNIKCSSCGKEVFASKSCSGCGAGLLVKCPSFRCGEIQIKSNDGKCIKCGKPLK